MAVESEEGERAEHDVQLPQRRRLHAAQRVEVEGEAQAHAVGEQLAVHAALLDHVRVRAATGRDPLRLMAATGKRGFSQVQSP